MLRGYLEDDQLPFFILESCAGQHPDTVDGLYRVALSRPDFTWKCDGKSLVRTYKPAPVHHEDLPKIAMVPVSLSRPAKTSPEDPHPAPGPMVGAQPRDSSLST
ncbi:hypothetical protein BLJ79_20720 [Arthrobacter sp. UCD-GKA]|uniref:hypothetical protein n=1 Tax=Arthrobacter sp. UCD-GKA TaxID=1913576 RepID=UPI0008DD1086|nr:hypothetical protein [Arthrobacter sp. UCD-GKA]OIH82139.1 hypothetical protein BLJ79_20720 [Arthrobacter sp. UCD-GKA]